MSVRFLGLAIFAATMLTGCAGKPSVAQAPVWVSKDINGLQRSECNCGGIEDKKTFKKRREAEAKAQALRNKTQSEND